VAVSVAIDRSSATPLYQQLEDVIRRDIDRGAHHPGELLPSEGEICSRYDLSRSVVRQALAHLAQAGIIRTERGRGSFVAEPKLSERFVQRTTGFYDDLTRRGFRIDTRILRQEIAPVPIEARTFLGVDSAVRIDRVRAVEGRVLAYVRTYIPSHTCPGLERYDLADQSLYAHLREVYGLWVHGGTRTVEAVAAEGEVAEQLEVAPGTPLLLLRSAGLSEDGEPLEWFDAWHRADRTRFEVEIVPGEDARPFEQVIAPVGPVPVTGVPDGVAQRLATERAVAALSAPRYGDGAALARAVVAGGLGIVEFALTGSDALEAIRQARAGVPDALVGAGSVLSVDDAWRAVEAGAQFLVALACLPEVAAARLGVPLLLAGSTPSEVLEAHRLTHGPVTFFPALGGPAMLRMIAAALPQVPLVASGGVDEDNLADYLAAGAVAVRVSFAPVTAADTAAPEQRAARIRRVIQEAS